VSFADTRAIDAARLKERNACANRMQSSRATVFAGFQFCNAAYQSSPGWLATN
jgi:hypothetical protein